MNELIEGQLLYIFILGLFLFARGISVFCQSRPTPVRNENNTIP